LDGVELDIHATADGELVIHHDPIIPQLGPIAGLSWKAISTYRLLNGEPVPRLADALQVLENLEVWIEVKALPAELDQTLLDVIDDGPAPNRYAVHSFDHRIIARLGARRPSLTRGILSASYTMDPAHELELTGATAYWLSYDLIDEARVQAIHEAKAELIAWTVNDPATAARLAAMGVDALCGNYPESLRPR
jgi:glycerophosphoryl diester phosphodiesterase